MGPCTPINTQLASKDQSVKVYCNIDYYIAQQTTILNALFLLTPEHHARSKWRTMQ